MAKRKAIMKNIIYELDNDDIEISSEEEVSGPKVTRLEPQKDDKSQETVAQSEPISEDVICVDSTDDSTSLIDSANPIVNGGKSNSKTVLTIDDPDLPIYEVLSQDVTEAAFVTPNKIDVNKTILNEDTEDSTSLYAVGCKNRIPLVTVRFKNRKLSSSCKLKVKKFIIDLLKQQQKDILVESDNDLDHELDIWPEDVTEECCTEEIQQTKEKDQINIKQQIKRKQDCDDKLFFVDTSPCDNLINDIPKYSQVFSVMSNEPDNEVSSSTGPRRGPKCYNCDGEHWLRECKYPKNYLRITEKRHQSTKVGRYHIEDDQKYGHLIPGRISGALRHALGLKRNELPLFIYKMRMLGYPPGWLEDARISHSGITMFDSSGTAILDPEDEEGEICEIGSKDKFDIKKILDFPGFNVPASSRYTEEAYLYGLPPISEQDSKISMLQMLAPNAMKAYKRKKLTFFPSAINSSLKEGQAEMDLDSGDETAEFPLVPPLPDDAPPPLPPPPEQPPPPPSSPPPPTPSPPADDATKAPTTEEATNDLDTSDVEITSVTRVLDIPISEDSLIVIDECSDNELSESGTTSPSLNDLEKKKLDLIEALETDISVTKPDEVSVPDDTDAVDDEPANKVQGNDADTHTEMSNVQNNNEDKPIDVNTVSEDTPSSSDVKDINVLIKKDTRNPDTACTPEAKTGHVKTTSLGTPILNIASPFVKLPSDDKFSKQICDVINFENLPNSTGKYKKIRHMLRRVKYKVDRIQDF